MSVYDNYDAAKAACVLRRDSGAQSAPLSHPILPGLSDNPPKPTVSRGDVALVLFPNSNLSSAKTRPALIVQADDLQTGLPQIIVAIITSQMFRAGHPSRVTILLNSRESIGSVVGASALKR